MDILDAIAAHAASDPARPAHRWSGGDLTWGELWHQSGALAGRLAAELPHDRAPVVVLAHKQSLALVAMLACVRAGRPYVPVDDSVAPGRLADILAAASASALLAVSPAPHVPLPAGCALWPPDAVAAAATAHTPPPDRSRATHGDQIWYVIFTSGSTGAPKGVQISANNLAGFLDWMVGLVPPGPQTILNQAPWSFDLSVMDTWPALVTGSTLVSIDRDEIAHPARLVAALRNSDATVWVSTPSFAALCLSFPGFDSSLVPVETFLFCGETLPPATASALLDRFPGARVHNTYGPTEATVAVTGLEITRDVLATHGVLPVGRPKPGCTITIRTPEGAPVDEGATGEIWIHGDSVSAGYLGRPDLTGQAFAGLRQARPTDAAQPASGTVPTYRTGDAGRLVGDMLFFGGRLDNQVKLHGYRIELGDIEANLNRLPQVAACVVLPRGEGGAVEYLEAFVQLADADTPRGLLTTLALRKALGELLPDYMVPKTFHYVEEFPMTTNGKVDRRALAGG